MQIKQWLNNIAHNPVSDSSLSNAAQAFQIEALDAELLLAHHLQKGRAYVMAFSDECIPPALLPQLNRDITRLKTGYPLAYVTGRKSFWDMELTVTKDTLIPRPDTETLLENLIELLSPSFSGKIIDLGTGSGALAIAISRIFPKANIFATDISLAALNVAKKNAQEWQHSPITFAHASWFDVQDASQLPKQFNVIVSNPPYIEENDPHLAALPFEPITALTAADNGLADITTIVEQSFEHLNSKGWLLLEHGYNQGKAVRQLFDKKKWCTVKTYRDLGGNERITVARRT